MGIPGVYKGIYGYTRVNKGIHGYTRVYIGILNNYSSSPNGL